MCFQNLFYKPVLVFVLLIQLFNTKLEAQTILEDGKEFTVPAGNANQLFYLQRNENINTVVYELNETNGVLNVTNPIYIFWIMYAKSGEHEELSAMEKKMAYGIKLTSIGNESYEFTLASYSKLKLRLSKDANKKYRVYVTPGKQKMILHRVYLEIKKKSFELKPDVTSIKFTGIDVLSGKEITEEIIP